MTHTSELSDRVRQAAAGTPYAICDEHPTGFTLGIDVVDRQRWGLYANQRLTMVHSHVVEVDERSGRYSVTDRSTTLAWEGGAAGAERRPVLRASSRLRQGTVRQLSLGGAVDVASLIRGGGQPTVPSRFAFSSGEGRQIIENAAASLQLTRRMDRSSRIGLIVGLGAVGAVVLAAAIVLVTGALLGWFS